MENMNCGKPQMIIKDGKSSIIKVWGQAQVKNFVNISKQKK